MSDSIPADLQSAHNVTPLRDLLASGPVTLPIISVRELPDTLHEHVVVLVKEGDAFFADTVLLADPTVSPEPGQAWEFTAVEKSFPLARKVS